MIIERLLHYDGRILRDMAWELLTLENSWVEYGSPQPAPQFQMDIFGYVTLMGMMKNGTTTDPTTVATLPKGFWPPDYHYFTVAISGPSSCVIAITPTGEISGKGLNATWTSLAGIRFRTY